LKGAGWNYSLALLNVLRRQLRDDNGRQMWENIAQPGQASNSDRRILPVANASHAVWSRRPYFQRAIAEPQASRPYLAITDARMCVTLSIMIRNATQQGCVYCADILWEEHR
jgi:hypothetical protein